MGASRRGWGDIGRRGQDGIHPLHAGCVNAGKAVFADSGGSEEGGATAAAAAGARDGSDYGWLVAGIIQHEGFYDAVEGEITQVIVPVLEGRMNGCGLGGG